MKIPDKSRVKSNSNEEKKENEMDNSAKGEIVKEFETL